MTSPQKEDSVQDQYEKPGEFSPGKPGQSGQIYIPSHVVKTSLNGQGPIPAQPELERDAAKKPSLRQLCGGFVGKRDFAAGGNAAIFAGVGKVLFAARRRQ